MDKIIYQASLQKQTSSYAETVLEHLQNFVSCPPVFLEDPSLALDDRESE